MESKNIKSHMYHFLLSVFCLISSCEKANMNDPIIDNNARCNQLYPPADTVIASHTPFTKTNYPARIKVFQTDTINEGDIVMLGNSLTEQGGNWNNKLNQITVKNRGIAGDNTDGVLARLNELICRKPSAVFVMIGTNDLFTNYSAQHIAQNIDTIGQILTTELPTSKIIVQTIMPLGAGNAQKSKLLEVNKLLLDQDSNTYTLIDTFGHMANTSGDLPPEYTTDGVHLTSVGYSKWVELLKTELTEE